MRISDWSSDVCSSYLDDPLIDLSVFRNRTWLVSTLSLGLMFWLFFGNIVLTPLWLQQMMGYTATWAGFATAPMGILAVLTAPIVGRLMSKIDPRLIVTYGMVVLAIRSEEHTSELQSLMRISYAVFCLKKKKTYINK